jgi:uracil phosphoribosyltransferase
LTDCSAGLLGHAIPRVASSLSGALSTTVIDDSPGDHGYIALGLGNMSDRMLGTK